MDILQVRNWLSAAAACLREAGTRRNENYIQYALAVDWAGFGIVRGAYSSRDERKCACFTVLRFRLAEHVQRLPPDFKSLQCC